MTTMRDLRISHCLHKARFSSKRAARDMRGRVMRRDPNAPPLDFYHCDICDGWHLTKKKNNLKNYGGPR